MRSASRPRLRPCALVWDGGTNIQVRQLVAPWCADKSADMSASPAGCVVVRLTSCLTRLPPQVSAAQQYRGVDRSSRAVEPRLQGLGGPGLVTDDKEVVVVGPDVGGEREGGGDDRPVVRVAQCPGAGLVLDGGVDRLVENDHVR